MGASNEGHSSRLQVEDVAMAVVEVRAKTERQTTTAPETPAKGRIERHMAGAPFQGRGSSVCFRTYKSPKAQVGRF